YRDECNQCIKNPSDACVQDCNNIWGGLAYVDGCGVCDSNPANDCIQDCNGEWGGTAYLDNCSICVGGNSGNSACVQDCNGTWGGTASGNECVDCFPPSTRDNCGVCTGGSTGNEPCSQDCAGVWGGLAELDNCGTCSGGDSGNIANAEMDCNNDCNGSAMINNCGECVGGNTGVEDSCVQDCQGVWGGLYPPLVYCQDGSIVCSISDCELLTIDQLIEIPQSFGIHKVFPNPFNPITTIEYTMNSASYYALTLYNIQGQKVANLAEGFSPAGKYRIQWNGKDFPSGIYFVILSSPHSIERQKIMLIK
ncbi:MAG: T9SS type A sorting domain-containing protein, partial [Candidatus Marinimicrobia bacterium]|nr:T9SS type A sorting domain-containing protein [Candidatus Neomarinimicrobiota bacterium]